MPQIITWIKEEKVVVESKIEKELPITKRLINIIKLAKIGLKASFIRFQDFKFKPFLFKKTHKIGVVKI